MLNVRIIGKTAATCKEETSPVSVTEVDYMTVVLHFPGQKSTLYVMVHRVKFTA